MSSLVFFFEKKKKKKKIKVLSVAAVISILRVKYFNSGAGQILNKITCYTTPDEAFFSPKYVDIFFYFSISAPARI